MQLCVFELLEQFSTSSEIILPDASDYVPSSNALPNTVSRLFHSKYSLSLTYRLLRFNSILNLFLMPIFSRIFDFRSDSHEVPCACTSFQYFALVSFVVLCLLLFDSVFFLPNYVLLIPNNFLYFFVSSLISIAIHEYII